jgi:uncharacterized protein YceH (UPF0502 family)
MPLLLTLAAITIALLIAAVSLWMRRTSAQIRDLRLCVSSWAENTENNLEQLAARTDPTALELAARQARRDARRRRNARAA